MGGEGFQTNIHRKWVEVVILFGSETQLGAICRRVFLFVDHVQDLVEVIKLHKIVHVVAR